MKKMGRPVGSTTRPQFYTYIDETDRVAFVKWAMAKYKEDPQLAKWVGDQLFGKAVQPIGNDGNEPFKVAGVEITIRK